MSKAAFKCCRTQQGQVLHPEHHHVLAAGEVLAKGVRYMGLGSTPSVPLLEGKAPHHHHALTACMIATPANLLSTVHEEQPCPGCVVQHIFHIQQCSPSIIHFTAFLHLPHSNNFIHKFSCQLQRIAAKAKSTHICKFQKTKT